jgi:hypothetical protein
MYPFSLSWPLKSSHDLFHDSVSEPCVDHLPEPCHLALAVPVKRVLSEPPKPPPLGSVSVISPPTPADTLSTRADLNVRWLWFEIVTFGRGGLTDCCGVCYGR